jgi:outer membrane protein assembly factor BamE (lipoprotein component of BamABCDE complex)
LGRFGFALILAEARFGWGALEPKGSAVTVRWWFVSLIGLALCCQAASVGYCAEAAPDPGRAREFSAATLAKVTPGQTTKAQIEALLGQPWRTTFADDSDEPGPLVWEYRGKDANGTYRVHIEFDSRGTTTLIAKIPDKTGVAPARVAKAPPATGRTQK